MFSLKFINVCNNVILKVLVDNEFIYIPNCQVIVWCGSPGECWGDAYVTCEIAHYISYGGETKKFLTSGLVNVYFAISTWK